MAKSLAHLPAPAAPHGDVVAIAARARSPPGIRRRTTGAAAAAGGGARAHDDGYRTTPAHGWGASDTSAGGGCGRSGGSNAPRDESDVRVAGWRAESVPAMRGEGAGAASGKRKRVPRQRFAEEGGDRRGEPSQPKRRTCPRAAGAILSSSAPGHVHFREVRVFGGVKYKWCYDCARCVRNTACDSRHACARPVLSTA